jgi:hypothetical protein
MNEVIFYKVDRDNLCETHYFDEIAKGLDGLVTECSIIFTAERDNLPETKYKKIVILGGDERCNAGLKPYSQYNDVVAVFRIYNEAGWFDNKYVFPIPCGYNCRSEDTEIKTFYPQKKISERFWDIFYSGQILNCRKDLVKKLAELSIQLRIYMQVNPSFRRGLPIDEYYKRLGGCKICVCPNGSAIDTFRFVEACASGCIIITTPKDDIWYYKDAPVFYIKDWNELTYDFIMNILDSDLDSVQEKTIDYYYNVLSPRAVAEYITETICNIN